MNSFYSQEELEVMGFGGLGQNVLISKKASIYGVKNIIIGNHVRIDDFCILSGKIILGDYIHISAYTGIFAGGTGVECEDYVTISSRNAIYAESDDYSGQTMTNPMIPDQYRGVYTGKVILKKFSIVGSGCTILPGVVLEEGASIGAMSLVNRNVDAWTINAGIPAKKIRDRSRELLDKEKEFRRNEG